jgi:sugar phosphate isomerase/epimerase
MNRRNLLHLGIATAAGAAFERSALAEDPTPVKPAEQRICLFTDHLDDHGFSYAEVAKMLRELGVTGPDLTVRGGGLVPPDRVTEELPKAMAAFREQGLTIPMVTTSITTDDAAAKALLSTAGPLGIRYYKTGYFNYDDPDRWQARQREVRAQLERLLPLGAKYGMQAGLHNHAGASVGGALWDGWEVLAPLDPLLIGFYFDPAQATIEGGNFAWSLNFRRAVPRLKMLAIKDFVWEKSGGNWRTRWVPLGEGMVRWPEFFRMLAKTDFNGPISLHIEYDPGGSTKAERFEKCHAAAARDLKFLREQIRGAAAKPS